VRVVGRKSLQLSPVGEEFNEERGKEMSEGGNSYKSTDRSNKEHGIKSNE